MDERDEMVEAMADAMAELHETSPSTPGWHELARAALDTINASGTHWVAPWEATATMCDVCNIGGREIYARMRDAHLAEQAGGRGDEG